MRISRAVFRRIGRLPWRGFRRGLIILLITWVLVSAAVLAAVYFYGQQDHAQQADAIVVLGSALRRDGTPGDALRRRSVWGAGLWQAGYAPHIICTGGIGVGQTRSEAEGCKEVLMANNVPEDAIYLEPQSRSTEENAINTRRILEANHWTSVLLVTDSFHSLRGHLIFNSYGITNYPSPVSVSGVRNSVYVISAIREVAALYWQLTKTVLNLPYTYVPFG